MDNYFNEERRRWLEGLSLGVLSSVAKNVGVRASSSLRKSELIDELMMVVYGVQKKEKESKTSVFVDRIKDLDGAMHSASRESIKSKELVYERMDTSDVSMANLASPGKDYVIKERNRKEFRYDGNDDENEIIRCRSGYIDIKDDKWVLKLLDSHKVINLTEQQCQFCDFNRYDNVECETVFSKFRGEEVLLTVKSINGIDVTLKNDGVKDAKKTTSRLLEMSNDNKLSYIINSFTPILKGSRVLVVGDNSQVRNRVLSDIMQSINTDDIVLMTLLVNKSNAEAFSLVDIKDNTVSIITPVSTTDEKIDNVISVFLRSERYVESGKTVVLMLDSYDELLEIFGGIKTKTDDVLMLANRFFNIGGRYANGASLTIIAGDSGRYPELTKALKNSATNIIPLLDYKTEGEELESFIDVLNIETKLNQELLKSVDSMSGVLRNELSKLTKDEYLELLNKLKEMKSIKKDTILNLILGI